MRVTVIMSFTLRNFATTLFRCSVLEMPRVALMLARPLSAERAVSA